MSFLIGIVMLGLIIFIHELGHFLSAKFFKIPVSEFSIGMGPQVFSLDTEKTMYSFRAIPIGGYVNIEGMEIESEVENGFNTKPTYQRLIVLFGGVFMNFLTAFILLFLTVKLVGRIEIEKSSFIGTVSKDSINYGILKNNDKILEIEGNKIEKWQDIPKQIAKLNGKEGIVVKIKREEKVRELKLKLMKDNQSDRYILGISPILKKIDVSYAEGLIYSLQNFKNIFRDTFSGFIKLFGGKANLKEMTGPVGIFKVVGDVSKLGVIAISSLAVIISINIGILNLLPIPALDGGRILFVIFEMLGFKINKSWEEKLHKIGMLLLLFFIVFISTNDILKLIK